MRFGGRSVGRRVASRSLPSGSLAVVALAVYSTYTEEGPGAIWMSLGALATGPILYPILSKYVKKDQPSVEVPIELEPG